MGTRSSLLNDLAGRSPLSLLQIVVRIFDRKAPLIENSGKKTIAKLAEHADLDVPEQDMEYLLNSASEKISSKLAAFTGRDLEKAYLLQGAALGLTAGVGAVLLQANDDNWSGSRASEQPLKKNLLTIGIYIAGGILASYIARQLKDNDQMNNLEESW